MHRGKSTTTPTLEASRADPERPRSSSNNIWCLVGTLHMAKYDGLLGQPVLEVEEPDKEGGITLIFKDNRFLFIKATDGRVETISIPE